MDPEEGRWNAERSADEMRSSDGTNREPSSRSTSRERGVSDKSVDADRHHCFLKWVIFVRRKPRSIIWIVKEPESVG